jgi:hypothetical protein
MQNLTNQPLNLFIGLGKFINAMRLFITDELQKIHGDSWQKIYLDSLLDNQKEAWLKNVQEGVDPSQLIDFGNLNSFALRQKHYFFSKYFGRESNNLPTIFNQMAEARNNLAHYLPFDSDKAEKAYLHMIEIAKKLEMKELEADLRKLKSDSFSAIQSVAIKENTSFKTSKNSENKSNKSEIISIINKNVGYNLLSNSNTVYANINKTNPVWWMDIPQEKFKNSLNILLIENDEVIWILIPSKTCYPPSDFFYIRNDNGKVQINIDSEDKNYLIDKLSSNFDFNPFIKNRFKL